MLASTDLAAALAAIEGDPFTGVLYRAVFLEALFGFHQDPPYPQPAPLYSLGASRTGARFTPRNGMATLYLAEDPETAFAEANQLYVGVRRINPAAVRPAPPTVILSAQVHLASLLDVTSPDVQTALETSAAELLAPWRTVQDQGSLSPTQLLGQVVFASHRFQAIRYPSAGLPGHCCLAIFPERLAPPAFVEVYDPHDNVMQRIP